MEPADLILHIDCDSFYVNCLASFNPSLKGQPVVVLSSNDGNVIARSRTAKALGIKMGQPYFQVKHLADKGKLKKFSSNYELFGDMFNRVMSILRRFSDQVEVYSIDEAFVGTKGIMQHYPDYVQLARQIQRQVYRWTRIPVSIGLGPTRALAKLANKRAKEKPDWDGLCLLDTPEKVKEVLLDLPVEKLWGIGSQLTRELNSHGIHTAYQLTQCPDEWIRLHLTVVGLRMVHELRGQRRIPLNTLPKSPKSVVVAPSFGRGITDLTLLEEALTTHIARAAEKIRRKNRAANLVTVMLHTNRFRLNEPQHHVSFTVSLPYASQSVSEIAYYALGILGDLYQTGYHYRKVGVMLSGLVPQDQAQGHLFIDPPAQHLHRVTELVDQINLRYGQDTLRFANQGFRTDWHSKRQWMTPCYTTRKDGILEVA